VVGNFRTLEKWKILRLGRSGGVTGMKLEQILTVTQSVHLLRCRLPVLGRVCVAYPQNLAALMPRSDVLFRRLVLKLEPFKIVLLSPIVYSTYDANESELQRRLPLIVSGFS
jgi:hypothetical protein